MRERVPPGPPERRRARESRWTCTACGGSVVPEGVTEREPVRCRACGARYRHPRLAILLSLALPGLGSIRQRHRIWGTTILVLGSGAFLWTVWRIFDHVRRVMSTDHPQLLRLLVEAGTGTGLVILAYLVDLLVVWLRRNQLVPVSRGGRR